MSQQPMADLESLFAAMNCADTHPDEPTDFEAEEQSLDAYYTTSGAGGSAGFPTCDPSSAEGTQRASAKRFEPHEVEELLYRAQTPAGQKELSEGVQAARHLFESCSQPFGSCEVHSAFPETDMRWMHDPRRLGQFGQKVLAWPKKSTLSKLAFYGMIRETSTAGMPMTSTAGCRFSQPFSDDGRPPRRVEELE